MATVYIMLSQWCGHCNNFKRDHLDRFLQMLEESGIGHEVIDITGGSAYGAELISRAGHSPTNVGVPAFVLHDHNTDSYYLITGYQPAEQLMNWLRQCLSGPSSSYHLSPLMIRRY